MERILTIQDFGDYASEVHRHFAEAYGFPWKDDDDTRPASDARVRMESAMRLALSEGPSRHPEEQAILAEAYALHEALSDYFAPTDPEWRARVAALQPRAAEAGRLLSALQRVRGRHALDERSAEYAATVTTLCTRWDAIEHGLGSIEFVEGDSAADSVAAERTDLAKLEQAIGVAMDDLHRVGNVIATVTAERATLESAPDLSALDAALKRAVQAVALVHEGVQSLLSVPSSKALEASSGPLDAYFSRILGVLPVTETRYYRPDETARPRRPVKKVLEVPSEYLFVQRKAEKRREAMLCFLATFREEFYEHLPSPCLRGHRPPPNTGGSGRRNAVLAGIGAAMVITGMMVAQPGDDRLPGHKLFEKVVTRTREMLARAGQRGTLIVGWNGADRRASGNSPSERFGRCIRPPVIERRPTTVVHVEQRRLREDEV